MSNRYQLLTCIISYNLHKWPHEVIHGCGVDSYVTSWCGFMCSLRKEKLGELQGEKKLPKFPL